MADLVLSIAGVSVWREAEAIVYAAGLAVDYDGAPNSYHPPTKAHPLSGRPPGLDDLRNAGGPGNWYGLVTDTGRATGQPVVQGVNDPASGFYVSRTALVDGTRHALDPRRYVDAASVPYVSVPGGAFRTLTRVGLGDLGVVCFAAEQCYAIVADIGPSSRIGEGSFALASALGLRGGRDARDVITVLFPGSRTAPAWPRAPDDLHDAATDRFVAWGGVERARAVVAGTP